MCCSCVPSPGGLSEAMRLNMSVCEGKSMCSSPISIRESTSTIMIFQLS